MAVRIHIFLLLVILSDSYIGNAENFSGLKYTVDVQNNSYLIITGSTNVGGFNCVFNMQTLMGKREVMVTNTDSGCLNFSDFELILPVSDFDCGYSQMNRDFQHLLNDQEYPQIEWKIICIDISSLNDNKQQGNDTMQVSSLIKIAGQEREYRIAAKVNKQGNQLSFSGELPLNIRDFKLAPPKKLFGLVEVLPTILIDFSVEIIILEKK